MHFEDSSSVVLLFDFWNVRGPGEMVLTSMGLLLLTVGYELLKVWKIHLRAAASSAPPPSHGDTVNVLGLPSESCLPLLSHTTIHRWPVHFLNTVLHTIQVAVAYMLMLCVMSYNVWVFLGVVTGSAVGYFIAFCLLEQLEQR